MFRRSIPSDLKSDLNSREFHFQERGSSKLGYKFLDYFYSVCATGNSFLDQSEQRSIYIIEEQRHDKLSHPKCVSLGYVNINYIQNKFFSITHLDILLLLLLLHNLITFAIADTKLDYLLRESQFLLPEMRKPFPLDVTSTKGGLLLFVNNNICYNIFEVFIFRDI